MNRDIVSPGRPRSGEQRRNKDGPGAVLHLVSVGIDIYGDPRMPPLMAARRDAEAVAELFRSRIRADELTIEVLCDADATRARVVDEISERLVRRAGPDDIVFLYFACHGSPERNGPRGEDKNYLVMHDTNYDRIYSTAIDMETTVLEWLGRLPARLAVLCLDACFSGLAGGRTLGGPSHLKFKDAFLSDEPLSLRDLELGHGRAIIAAAQDHQVALESLSLGHGIFTYHLLDCLGEPFDEPGVRTIGVATLADRLATRVATATDRKQVPLFNGRVGQARLPLLGLPVRSVE